MFDDGEKEADVKLANLLKQNNLQNPLIVVSRHVNKVHIRGDRFTNIVDNRSSVCCIRLFRL